MNEREFSEHIIEALYTYNEDFEWFKSLDVRTFDDLDILNKNEGFVVKIGVDKEFQITVVRSK